MSAAVTGRAGGRGGRWLAPVLVVAGSLAVGAGEPPEPTLEIFVMDLEGGKSTLFVAPSGESLLMDTGSPGGRDVGRILETLERAGVERLDYLLSTHYHSDHVGGLEELARRVPIAHYLDHGPSVEAREAAPGFAESYARLTGQARHTVLRAGDRVPIAGLDWRIVASAGESVDPPLPGAGAANPACEGVEPREAPEPSENAESVGSLVSFGRFRALDLGDLLWNQELALVCPVNRLGRVDLFLVTHHGLPSSNAPPLVHALRPRVAVMQNGPRKGGAVEVLETLRGSPDLVDVWLAHWSHQAGLEHNPAGVFVANAPSPARAAAVLAATGSAEPEPADHGPAHAFPLAISARADGSFTVSNPRNGFSRTYPGRSP